jgi:hypothetical protein
MVHDWGNWPARPHGMGVTNGDATQDEIEKGKEIVIEKGPQATQRGSWA